MSVGLLLDQDRLDLAQHLRGHRRVRARADAEIHVGPRDAEVAEEALRHRLVVVLAGVHQVRRKAARFAERAQQWRHLHEVGARAGDGDDSELLGLHEARNHLAGVSRRPV
jgi:hypothetical protein